MKKLFVWDFHGTLETGNVYAVKALINLVLKDFKINKKISIKEVREWYGLSWFDYFKLINPKSNDELWQDMVNRVLSLQEQGWNIIKTHIKPRKNSKEVLKKIKKEKHQSIILSNTAPQDIRKFTNLLNITKYFTDIIGIKGRYTSEASQGVQRNKTKALISFLEKKEYKKVIVIGDRESDIKTGISCGATTYLFLDPTYNKNNAKNTKAEHIISDLKEVLREL